MLCGWLRGVHFYFQGFAKGESSNKGALLILSFCFFFLVQGDPVLIYILYSKTLFDTH
mgnify:CR=1 FL=1